MLLPPKRGRGCCLGQGKIRRQVRNISADILEAKRTQRGLSYRELGARAGYDDSFVYRLMKSQGALRAFQHPASRAVRGLSSDRAAHRCSTSNETLERVGCAEGIESA